jgi:hypothetical protein
MRAGIMETQAGGLRRGRDPHAGGTPTFLSETRARIRLRSVAIALVRRLPSHTGESAPSTRTGAAGYTES